MKFDILKKIIIPVAIAGSLVSCKEKEENKILPSLEGKITFTTPEFIQSKSSLTITPAGAKHPEGKSVGYYWKISKLLDKGDTTRFENGLDKNGKESDGTLKYTFKDTVGTFTISCYAYAEGYSGITKSKEITIVNPALHGSIKGNDILPYDEHIKTADGKKYYYTKIGDRDWFRQNLSSEAGTPYRKSLVMADIFGSYYNYEEALKACPDGWRIPTEDDWISLAKNLGAPESQTKYTDVPDIAKKLMANATFNTVTMWDYWREVGDITNESKLAFIPVGYANLGEKDSQAKVDKWLDQTYPDATFSGIYDYAAFWTADKDGNQAYYRYIHVKSPKLKIGKADTKHFGASVRCVRDSK